ncbi:hypothetical protein ANTPLA_LOCUS9763 [Anthophora plagiata]
MDSLINGVVLIEMENTTRFLIILWEPRIGNGFTDSRTSSGPKERKGGQKKRETNSCIDLFVYFFCLVVRAIRRPEVSSMLEGLESNMAMDRYSTKG